MVRIGVKGANGAKWCQPARAFLSPAPQAPTPVLATGHAKLLLQALIFQDYYYKLCFFQN